NHAGVKCDIPLQIETVGDVVEIAPDLRMARIALAPLPLAEQRLREGVAVGVAFRIAARPGIPVPVPGAADPPALFQHPGAEAETVAQGQHLVEARKARADDQGIEAFVVRVCRSSHHLATACPLSPRGPPSAPQSAAKPCLRPPGYLARRTLWSLSFCMRALRRCGASATPLSCTGERTRRSSAPRRVGSGASRARQRAPPVAAHDLATPAG